MPADKPLRIPDLIERKRRHQKIAMLTAYDATMARLFDRAGIDALLVGDSLGMVIMGEQNTLGVTMDVMVHHTRAVANGAYRAIVIADMPFLSYNTGWQDAVRNAGRLIQEGSAHAVKLEGGYAAVEVISRIIEAGIPVMGHVGLTPQSVNAIGGFKRVGVTDQDKKRILEDAKAIEQAGAFGIVLEMVPADVARLVTESIGIPTIGIGAGPYCDGQILVGYDALGLFDEFVPSFVKQYVKLGEAIEAGTRAYVEEVVNGKFPLS
jgi:3-methyl-2-oxobutanoate hydroxymethyltransferase